MQLCSGFKQSWLSGMQDPVIFCVVHRSHCRVCLFLWVKAASLSSSQAFKIDDTHSIQLFALGLTLFRAPSTQSSMGPFCLHMQCSHTQILRSVLDFSLHFLQNTVEGFKQQNKL